MERTAEVGQFCDEHGIHFIAAIEPENPEDISDVERALVARQPAVPKPAIGRNDVLREYSI